MVAPVTPQEDKADVIDINERHYKVVEWYLGDILGALSKLEVQLTPQDREYISQVKNEEVSKPQLREGEMRIAAFLIVDLIERANFF